MRACQGRFWRESFADLGLPASTAAKFEFEDGYSRVRGTCAVVPQHSVQPLQQSACAFDHVSRIMVQGTVGPVGFCTEDWIML